MGLTLVALPEDNVLQQLNQLKSYYYQNWFRATSKPCTENSHITLLELKHKIPPIFQTELRRLLAEEPSILLTHFHTFSKEHTWVSEIPELSERFPNGRGNFFFACFFQKVLDICSVDRMGAKFLYGLYTHLIKFFITGFSLFFC